MKPVMHIKAIVVVCLAALLSACSMANFVGDAPPVPVTSQTPDKFELPARFAVARSVYGLTQAASAKEMVLWSDLADRAASLGSFTPLVSGLPLNMRGGENQLLKAARQQRYDYLLLIQMYPTTGSADVVLYHVGSGGVMATMQAVSPSGGQRGFWGEQITNPARLDRVTFAIAEVTVPAVEEVLKGAALRQR